MGEWVAGRAARLLDDMGVLTREDGNDGVLRNFAAQLRHAAALLELSLDQHTNASADGSSNPMDNAVSVRDIVAYAHKVSYSSYAPMGYMPGQPMRRGMPPAPQDEHMRASALYNAPVIVTRAEKKAKTAAAAAAAAATLPPTPALPPVTPAAPPSLEGAERQGAGAPMPAIIPPMPHGWKPGDPLPDFELPPMPEGWKPGDPVPLPAVPLVPPPTLAHVLAAPPASQDTGAAPGPEMMAGPVTAAAPGGQMVVPFVQLDLNPDLEEEYDDASMYSDESYSESEDEES